MCLCMFTSMQMSLLAKNVTECSGALQEQQVLLTAESSCQLQDLELYAQITGFPQNHHEVCTHLLK